MNDVSPMKSMDREFPSKFWIVLWLFRLKFTRILGNIRRLYLNIIFTIEFAIINITIVFGSCSLNVLLFLSCVSSVVRV
jgi:hypothetical protein